jgi:hypothetical protein
MPRSFWFWAIRHATRLSNIFPVKYEGKLTTPFELVFNNIPDLRQLFSLFSTTYFSHTKDNGTKRTNLQSHTLQGIAVCYSDVSNGMKIHNPLTKQLYTPNTYRLDEIREPFPIGTAIRMPTNTTIKHGVISSVTSNTNESTDPLYSVRFVDGSNTMLPQSLLSHFIDKSTTQKEIVLPSWIQPNKK